jgi:tRNA(fMet)-specific endonuclease VapC
MICLDTNAVTGAINGRVPTIREKLIAALSGETVALPAIALYELRYGVEKSTRREVNNATLEAFMSLGIAVWPFDAEDADAAGTIRADMERAGTPIGPYDILIAAQARCRSATLITSNTREFSRVPGLRCLDWSGEPA